MTKLKVLDKAKSEALRFGAIGLFLGFCYSFGGLLIDALVSAGWEITDSTTGLSYGTFLAFGALLGMPLLFALCGFLIGLVQAVLNNLFEHLFAKENEDLSEE